MDTLGEPAVAESGSESGVEPFEEDRGRFFEDFRVGQRIRHPLGRTVYAADNAWFSLLTQNQNPIHLDRHRSAATPFGKPLVNSALTLSLATGQSVHDLTRNVIANLGWDGVRLPAPLFEGDTLYSESEVIAVRSSRSRPEAGIVTVRTTGRNQDGTVVIQFRRTFLIRKRPTDREFPARRQEIEGLRGNPPRAGAGACGRR